MVRLRPDVPRERNLRQLIVIALRNRNLTVQPLLELLRDGLQRIRFLGPDNDAARRLVNVLNGHGLTASKGQIRRADFNEVIARTFGIHDCQFRVSGGSDGYD